MRVNLEVRRQWLFVCVLVCGDWLSSDVALKTFADIQLRQASEPVKIALGVLLSSRSHFCVN